MVLLSLILTIVIFFGFSVCAASGIYFALIWFLEELYFDHGEHKRGMKDKYMRDVLRQYDSSQSSCSGNLTRQHREVNVIKPGTNQLESSIGEALHQDVSILVAIHANLVDAGDESHPILTCLAARYQNLSDAVCKLAITHQSIADFVTHLSHDSVYWVDLCRVISQSLKQLRDLQTPLGCSKCPSHSRMRSSLEDSKKTAQHELLEVNIELAMPQDYLPRRDVFLRRRARVAYTLHLNWFFNWQYPEDYTKLLESQKLLQEEVPVFCHAAKTFAGTRSEVFYAQAMQDLEEAYALIHYHLCRHSTVQHMSEHDYFAAQQALQRLKWLP